MGAFLKRGDGDNELMRIVPWLQPLFRDRAAAGRVLAEALGELDADGTVVVGVARGGVAVAVEVARALNAPLTAIDVERVNSRGLRLGATTAQGPSYLLPGQGVPQEEVQRTVEQARRAAETVDARIGAPPAQLEGRTAVVVDDGVITGLTLSGACRWARGRGVARLLAATPVGHVRGLARVGDEADLVVCPNPLEEISVVGQAYDSFDSLDEWYVAGLLDGTL